MRVLMVSLGYPPVLSGVTLVVQEIARVMVQRGHQVMVVTASDQEETYGQEDKGVQLARVRAASNPFWDDGPIPFIGQGDLEAIAAEDRPDVIHDHEAAILGLQAQRLSAELGVPCLAICYYVPRFAARYPTWSDEPHEIVESLTWAYSIWFFDRFDHVVFATEAHRDEFLQEGLEVPTTIISNGYLVPPGQPEVMAEAMGYILSDPDRAVCMGQASLSIAQPHAEEQTFDGYEALYHELVSVRGNEYGQGPGTDGKKG